MTRGRHTNLAVSDIEDQDGATMMRAALRAPSDAVSAYEVIAAHERAAEAKEAAARKQAEAEEARRRAELVAEVKAWWRGLADGTPIAQVVTAAANGSGRKWTPQRWAVPTEKNRWAGR